MKYPPHVDNITRVHDTNQWVLFLFCTFRPHQKMKTICIFFLLLLSKAAMAMPQDSIGTKVVDGQRYIMHKVTKGEGVFSIGKKYGVPAADIFAANEGSEKTIKLGQVLLIPKAGKSGNTSGKSGTASNSTSTKTEKIYHVVSSGQTLSAIARQHQTTVANIKQLNNLKSDNINLGQKLVVGEKTTTVASTPKPKEKPISEEEKIVEKMVTPTPPAKTPEVNEDKTSPEPKNVVVTTDKIKEKPAADYPGVINTYSTDDGDEITENGLAVISAEGDLSQERSFILHPTAKVGTIVMITNATNNNAVFARVIGNCKVENGCILKMSKTVATKLGVSENIPVKVSYAK
jgi:LysM repeat protein